MVIFGSVLDGGEKITLDQDSFKALASETRIGILKKLDKTQLTVSDLARELKMSKATLFEHLEKLIKVGLIKKKEDNRKWVYYKLTWKGKNILHPERTKIAIVLTVVVFACIILVALITIWTGNLPFGFGGDEQDISAPKIQFTEVEDITENTVSPDSIEIEVSDNKKIIERSLVTKYKIYQKYYSDPDFISNWIDLPSSIEDGKIELDFSEINWSENSGKYLYILCSVQDEAGNTGIEMFVEYIDKMYENSIDLSISSTDIIVNNGQLLKRNMGIRSVPIEIKVHNTGTLDVNNVQIMVFTFNPDINRDWVLDNESKGFELITKNIDSILPGQVINLDLKITLDLREVDYIKVFVDPLDRIAEVNETNNLAIRDVIEVPHSSVVPEFPPIIGVIIVFLLIIIITINRKKSVKP
jgi:DNA-binding transcriptional ArsR family regulator